MVELGAVGFWKSRCMGQNPPILGNPRLRGPAFPGLSQQFQVISWKFYQVPEGSRFNIWWPAQEHILKVQGLNDLHQRDLGWSKVAVTLPLWRLGVRGPKMGVGSRWLQT
jgi:hypothetical protein